MSLTVLFIGAYIAINQMKLLQPTPSSMNYVDLSNFKNNRRGNNGGMNNSGMNNGGMNNSGMNNGRMNNGRMNNGRINNGRINNGVSNNLPLTGGI